MKELLNKITRFYFSRLMDMDIVVPGKEKVRNPSIKLNKKLAIAVAVTRLIPIDAHQI